MKKILWLFLAVAFTAAPVFAQELKFSGYANYGLGLEYSTEEGRKDPATGTSNNVTLRMAGVDSSQIGGRFRLNGSYTNADKNLGADFRLQLQGSSGGTGGTVGGDNTYDLALVYAYGWVKPIDMLLIKAGIVADSTFETGGAILGDDAGSGAGAGAFIKLTPVSGLDIGFGAYPKYSDGGSNNNRIYNIGGTVRLWEVKYTFGVAYTMPEVFKVNLSFRSFNSAGGSTAATWDIPVTSPAAANSGRNTARAVGEFRLLAVKDLTAILEVELDKLWSPKELDQKFGDVGLMNFYETVAYKIGDLTVGLNAAQYISNVDNTDVGLRFNPWVSYAISEGKIVPRLDGIIFLAGDRVRWTSGNIPGDYGKYDRKNDLAPTYKTEDKVFGGRPSVKINFDSRTVLEIGDVLYYRKPAVGDSFIDNVFYLDLVVRF